MGDVEDLSTKLNEAISLLENVEEKGWSEWLRENLNLITNRDFCGILRLLGGFGGMGSFNDLMIHPENGHKIQHNNIDKVNDCLDALRSELYRLAFRIKREVEQE